MQNKLEIPKAIKVRIAVADLPTLAIANDLVGNQGAIV